MQHGTIINIWLTQPDHITITETFWVGEGRQRRRQLARWRTVPRLPSESLSDVLRRVADEFEARTPAMGQPRA